MKGRPESKSYKGGFPETRLTAIAAISSSDQTIRAQGLDTIAAAYWAPIYKYIRLKWDRPADTAEDLTQAFFAAAIEKNFFEQYDPAKSKFRTFLRVCLDGFIANQDKSAGRLKRGGGLEIQSFDFQAAEVQLNDQWSLAQTSMDDFFEKEWVRGLFGLAVQSLQNHLTRSGKEIQFQLFQRYALEEHDDEERITYADLASEFSIPVTTVTNYLAAARRDFKKILLETLRKLTVSDDEFRQEARALFGAHFKDP